MLGILQILLTIKVSNVSKTAEYSIKIQKATVFLNTSKLVETKIWKKYFKNQILRNKFNCGCIKPLHRKLQNFAERHERSK